MAFDNLCNEYDCFNSACILSKKCEDHGGFATTNDIFFEKDLYGVECSDLIAGKKYIYVRGSVEFCIIGSILPPGGILIFRYEIDCCNVGIAMDVIIFNVLGTCISKTPYIVFDNYTLFIGREQGDYIIDYAKYRQNAISKINTETFL